MGEIYYVEKNAQVESPYGTWTSPITGELITKGAKKFEMIVLDEKDIYWNEMRPSEGGRSVIVKVDESGKKDDVTPQGYSVRTRVHEYGGGAFTVAKGTVYFINDKDQRIYTQKIGTTPHPLTKAGSLFSDLKMTSKGLVSVCEIHQENGQVDNFLALVNPTTGEVKTLASGYDFYSSPAISNDEKKLAWLSWNHPNMPWDGNELWVADFKDGSLENPQCVAGGPAESIFEPQWSPHDILYFVSDKTGWWNLYRLGENGAENIYPLEAEFGTPQWIFGMSTWAFANNHILCNYFQNGLSHLVLIDPDTKETKELDLKGSDYSQLRANHEMAVFIQGSPTSSRAIVKLDLKTLSSTILGKSDKIDIPESFFSIAQPIAFPSAEGRISYGYYYPPKSKDFKGPIGDLPPLIVKSHGGPTAAVSGVFSLGIQYWTSRGFAVLDVNYGGSSGYGRAYRELLKKNWGIVDVQDCEYGAKYLVEKGLVNPKKLAITGGSAGGYTTLAALTFGKTFTVGASYYGVSDLAALAKETHKFESHYLDGLVGPYPSREDLYKERSPIEFVNHLCCPVIFFQGLEDKVVPPNQAEMMYQALQKKGIPSKLVLYPDEQHGFRKAENIKDSLEKELEFYLWVFYYYIPSKEK